MNPLIWFKSCIQQFQIRRKFPTSVIYAGAYIDQSSTLGEHSVLFRDVGFINSNLGAYSYIQSSSVVCNADIGGFCSIASNVSIGLANHPLHMVSTSPVFYDISQPLPKFLADSSFFTEALPQTTVGADVWIGQGAMIKAGVTIGVGAVIGAGSIVTRDIAPYSIAAGNPCKEIRSRFDEDTVKRLIATDWWRRSERELKLLVNLFVDPTKLLEVLERCK